MPKFIQNVMSKQLGKDLFVIFGLAGVVTALAMWFHLDTKLAIIFYDPDNAFAWWVRQESLMPGIIVSVAALVFLLVWPLRLRFPLWRKVAIVWLLTLILGGGLVNQVIVKELAQRPRPRETVILGGQVETSSALVQRAAIKGKSFPSGHIAIGIMFATPFYVLRRRKPKWAKGFLYGGLAFAGVIGTSRMILGAHYLTDLVWGAAITMAAAAIFAQLIKDHHDVPSKYTIPFIALAAFLVAWFNKFNIDLHHQPTRPHITLQTPCDDVEFAYGNTFKIDMQLKGYGAPLTLLQLQESSKGKVFLQRYLGIYRGLDCSAQVELGPQNSLCFESKDEKSGQKQLTCVSHPQAKRK